MDQTPATRQLNQAKGQLASHGEDSWPSLHVTLNGASLYRSAADGHGAFTTSPRPDRQRCEGRLEAFYSRSYET